MQTRLENDNTQQKPPVHNKSDFKVPNKYVQSSENNSVNNTYIFTSNRYQELSKNDDTENESNTRDYVKLTKAAESKKSNLGKKNNLTQEKNQGIQQSTALKKHSNM